MRAILIECRAVFRLARVGLHLLWGALTVAVLFPWIGIGLQRALKRRWSRQLLDAFGIALQKVGAGGTAGLIVCNHISWLDIFVINAATPVAFVSKGDVRHWPLIGWLCIHSETIFIERGSRVAAQRTREAMVDSLANGVAVSVFPEGTTTNGDRVLPFHGALFQSAIDAHAPVQPLALRYLDAAGQPSRAPAYDGDVTLWQSMCALAHASGLQVHLRVLAPLDSALADRRHLAARCHHAIAWHLGHLPVPAPVPLAAADTDSDLTSEPHTA